MKPTDTPRTVSDLNEEERMALKTARTIAIAMIVGVVLFGAVAGGISVSGKGSAIAPPSLQGVPQDVLLIAGLAAALLLASIPGAVFVRKQALARAVNPQTGRVEPGMFLTTTIITMALLEAPALTALVSCVIGKSLWPGGVVALVAVVAMMFFVPRVGQFGRARESESGGMYGYREPEKWR